METVTLHSEDFKTVHNTLCDLRSLVQRMTHSMIKIDDVQNIIEGFERGLADAYRQDEAAFERKNDHYAEVRQRMGLSSIWSIYEVEDLDLLHPYHSAAEICYRDHWGDEAVYETIQGVTWADLYAAADRCIRRSGDGHHIFIESFQIVSDQPHQLRLTTGS